MLKQVHFICKFPCLVHIYNLLSNLFTFTDAILSSPLDGNIWIMDEDQLSSKMNMEQGSQTEGRFWLTCTGLGDFPER